MKVSDLGEFGLIERIRRASRKAPRRMLIGIGDDAAALSLSPSATLLASTDLLIEGVHFDLATTGPAALGWKAAAVNLSDIAAMGGTPRFCLVGLGIPSRVTVEQIAQFYRGLRGLLGRYRTVLAGGDTCRSDRAFLISVTLLGEARRRLILTRGGARPGDRVFVTGTLGDSGAGLELLRSGECGVRNGKAERKKTTAWCRKLIGRHLRPEPRVEWGRKLADSGCVSAMIDVSDGLSSDLAHICEESGVGAEVHADQVPLSRALRTVQGMRRPVLDYALSGGEDYELLFTVPESRVRRLRGLRLPVTEIGRITAGRRLRLIMPDGTAGPLLPSGFDHFRGQAGRKRSGW